jgi:hypothetical protein
MITLSRIRLQSKGADCLDVIIALASGSALVPSSPSLRHGTLLAQLAQRTAEIAL